MRFLLLALLILALVVPEADAWRRRRRRRRRHVRHYVRHVVHHIHHHYHHHVHSVVRHVHHVVVHHVHHYHHHVYHRHGARRISHRHRVIHHHHVVHHFVHHHHRHVVSRHHHHHRMARHHSARARLHHHKMLRHRKRARHHAHHARRHSRHARHHHKRARHHAKRARHHRSRHAHHLRMARHHARHGRHHLARHHRRLAHHHKRHARHHARRSRHHRRHARRHRRHARRHRRLARHHGRRARHHRRMRNHHRRRARHHRRRARRHHHHHKSIRHIRRNLRARLRLSHVHHRSRRGQWYRHLKHAVQRHKRRRELGIHHHHGHHDHSVVVVGHHHHHHWHSHCKGEACLCRRSVRHYRHALHRAEHKAQACGLVDSHCVDVRYRKVASIRMRLSELHKRCHKHIHIVKSHFHYPHIAAHHHRRKRLCGHNARRYLRRQKGRRAALMARVHKCSDMDSYCVVRLLKGVTRLNRKIHARARLCHIGAHYSPHAPHNTKTFKCHMKPQYTNRWHHALLCPSKMAHFKRWVKYWNCKRKEVFAESCLCDPLDTACLRSHFTQIRHIQTRIAHGRREFIDDIKECDKCAHLKLHFMYWQHRMQVRRNRLHDAICRCRPQDLDCSRRRVERIKAIQRLIRKRRAEVLALHGDCKARDGMPQLHGSVPMVRDTLPPHPDKWLRFAKDGEGEHKLTEADVVSGNLGFRAARSSASSLSSSALMVMTVVVVAALVGMLA